MGKIWLLLFFIPFSTACFAQEDSLSEMTDTTVEMTPPVVTSQNYSDEEQSPFLPSGQADTFQLRQASAKQIDRLKKSDDYWYANIAPPKNEPVKPPVERDSLFDQGWFKALFWVVVIGSLVGAIVWFLASNNTGLFRRPSKKILAEEDEMVPEDIFEVAYPKEIAKAKAAENYRLAIRLWYLSTLKELTSKNLITYSRDRTNSDYLFQLFGSRYYNPFFRLTRNFDYTWYGQFPLTADGYQLMEAAFIEFKNGLV